MKILRTGSELIRAILATTAFRLTSLYVAGFLLASAVIVAVMFWQTNDLLTRQMLAAVRAEIAGLETVAKTGGPEMLRAAVAERSRGGAGSLYFLADGRGQKLAGNLNRWPPEIAMGEAGGLFRYAVAPDVERLAVGIPAVPVAGSHVLVARDVEEQRRFVGDVRQTFLVGFGLLALIGLAAGVAASRLVLHRVGRMVAASEDIMKGDLSRRVPLAGSGDELDHLAQRLNAMLERIEQLVASLREVTDNVAHDLKTPLTRLRNRAEAALRGGVAADGHRDALVATIEAADDLIRTFSAMLLVARLEAGVLDESATSFDLAQVAQDVVELYEPAAEAAGATLTLTARPVMVRANRQLVGQAIANLVDNAIKYGAMPQAGDRITIAVTAGPIATGARLTVTDRGPGIALADRERALKRFVRLEASRSRPGSGLGLSLVAAVARLSGGALVLEENAPGLRAVLELPAAPSGAVTAAVVEPA